MFRNALWVHYIDNAAGLASLVDGSSSVEGGDLIIGETWKRVQQLKALPWFDRVDAHSNVVDGLSRGRWDGPWHLRGISFPQSLAGLLRRRSAA